MIYQALATMDEFNAPVQKGGETQLQTVSSRSTASMHVTMLFRDDRYIFAIRQSVDNI